MLRPDTRRVLQRQGAAARTRELDMARLDLRHAHEVLRKLVDVVAVGELAHGERAQRADDGGGRQCGHAWVKRVTFALRSSSAQEP